MCVSFLNFEWDAHKINMTFTKKQVIPSPLKMRSYEMINFSSPARGTDLFTNHRVIPVGKEQCFEGLRIGSYLDAITLRRYLLVMRNALIVDYDNNEHKDGLGLCRFKNYLHEPSAVAFFCDVKDFQRIAVRNWNPNCNEVTLSFNMGFVGVCEDSSDGSALVIMDMLLNFGVLIYNDDDTWALHKFAKVRRMYCFGNCKTIENSTAFFNKLSNRSLSFKETSIQAEIFLDAFDRVMFLPGDWHTGMNQLQSIYKLFWTDLLKPLRDHLGWKRISNDVQQCYYQASRLVKYTYKVISAYLLCAYISRHISRFDDRIRDVPPGDLLCDLVSDYKTFLTDTLNSNDEHTKLIVNFLFISGDFLDFVAAYRNQDSIMVEVGYKTFAPIWKLLGQNKYLEAAWEQMDALYHNFPYSRLQEV